MEQRAMYTVTPTHSASPAQVVAGSARLDPVMAEYLRMRWRVCMTELHYIASVLGWESRLPRRQE